MKTKRRIGIERSLARQTRPSRFARFMQTLYPTVSEQARPQWLNLPPLTT